jgi:hypothetical protein
MNSAIDFYERRILQKTANIPMRSPWKKRERLEILELAKLCLGVRDEWIPEIKAELLHAISMPDFVCECLSFTSWPGVIGTATLYKPVTKNSNRLPLVILCCGHGENGKLAPAYQLMARHICRQGAVVLVPDNIGQGERSAMGHHGSIGPFAQGGSLQGLIVMETMAWLRWAQANALIDSTRIAAIGNSGGGVLTLFLAAFCPELAVVSSSGYPSSFEFIARKEKIHCACNLLPGIIGRLEMWHLLGCFAPKPLLLFQGINDQLFPIDVFLSTVRKVKRVYDEFKSTDNFHYHQINGEHSWNRQSREVVGAFLAKYLGVSEIPSLDSEELLSVSDVALTEWPENALQTDDIIPSITGQKCSQQQRLWDIYPPLMPDNIEDTPRVPRDKMRHFFAQLECFMTSRGF